MSSHPCCYPRCHIHLMWVFLLQIMALIESIILVPSGYPFIWFKIYLSWHIILAIRLGKELAEYQGRRRVFFTTRSKRAQCIYLLQATKSNNRCCSWCFVSYLHILCWHFFSQNCSGNNLQSFIVFYSSMYATHVLKSNTWREWVFR